MVTIGERVDYIRRNAKLSQKEFAKYIGISESAVSRIISNQQSINPVTKNFLHTRYRVNIVWLETGEGEPYETTQIADNLNSILMDFPAVHRAVSIAVEKMSVADWQKLNDFIDSLGGTL